MSNKDLTRRRVIKSGAAAAAGAAATPYFFTRAFADGHGYRNAPKGDTVTLGFNVPQEKFLEAIKEHQPDIVGMSALLTTTMRSMGHTIKAIEEAGLRDNVKIMVGGAPVDAEFADRIGADGRCRSADHHGFLLLRFACRG